MKNLLLLFILSLSQICNSQKSDEMAESLNKKSKQIFETGDVERALPILKQAAEKGSAEAQYNLGYCYQSGIGNKRSKIAPNHLSGSLTYSFFHIYAIKAV